MIAVVASHAVLIPGGGWRGDEYFNFAAMRQAGFPFVAHRLLRWSPRPLSELLVHLYAGAVAATGRPLVSPVLTAAWAVWIAGAACGLPPVITCAALLVIGDVTAGARRRGACAAALIVAAASTESGAVFVLCFTALFALADRRAPAGRAWLGIPLVLAAAALALMASGRQRHQDARQHMARDPAGRRLAAIAHPAGGRPCCQRHVTFEGILLLTSSSPWRPWRPGGGPPRRRRGQRRWDRPCWRRR